MRNLKSILIILFSAGILLWFVTWWMIAAVSFVVAVTHKLKPKEGFISSFFGIALLWMVIALWRDLPNEHILSNRMAGVLGLPNGWLFVFITIIVGGLLGGVAGWSGGMMNKAFRS
jgi:hypothetical protein